MDNSNVSSSGQNDPIQPPVNQPQQPVSQPVAVPQPPQVQQPAVPVSPASQGGPVGSVNKEFGPTAVSTHEVMTPAGEHVEPQVSPEVKEAGVVAVKEVPDLTLHDQKAGVHLSKESVPHPTSPSGMVSYPMTEGEAKEVLKHKNARSAWYWAAVAVLKQIHKKLLNP